MFFPKWRNVLEIVPKWRSVKEILPKWRNVLEIVPKWRNVLEIVPKWRNVLEIVSKWKNVLEIVPKWSNVLEIIAKWRNVLEKRLVHFKSNDFFIQKQIYLYELYHSLRTPKSLIHQQKPIQNDIGFENMPKLGWPFYM